MFRTRNRSDEIKTAFSIAVVIALLATACPVVAASPTDRQPIDDELEKYWNIELAVPTVTNPMHPRSGSFEGTIVAGMVPNDSYYVPLPVGVRLAAHLLDSVAVEASFTYLLGGTSDLHYFLEHAGKSGLLQGVQKPPRMTMLTAVDLVYSPFHGKVGVFASKLSSFDIALAIGAGLIGADIDDSPETEETLVSKLIPAGHWGATVRFYVTDWLCIRADYRQFVYVPQDDAAPLFPAEITGGLSILTN